MCRACRHNHMIPDLSEPSVPPRWAKIEAAKRRLFHTLIKLKLPLDTRADAKPGVQALAFDFLYDPDAEQHGKPAVMTGHDDGLITLNLIEADDAERERTRHAMGEPYRTLLGHFRHEVGHHYWARIIETNEAALDEFRAIFGDERADYDAALQQHYARTDDHAWRDDYISFYATSHPWEDFAETFAHYLHVVDLLATARGLGLSLTDVPIETAEHAASLGDKTGIAVDFNPYTATAATLAGHIGALAFSMNAMGRSLGQPDPYPFALGRGVVDKLDFIARMIAERQWEHAPAREVSRQSA